MKLILIATVLLLSGCSEASQAQQARDAYDRCAKASLEANLKAGMQYPDYSVNKESLELCQKIYLPLLL